MLLDMCSGVVQHDATRKAQPSRQTRTLFGNSLRLPHRRPPTRLSAMLLCRIDDTHSLLPVRPVVQKVHTSVN